ncbi:hypothetical protein DVH05_011709 [Phytophthora capsici]|nr:hypothetical protein DVH05_011709 [Phytophthora capsici]
MSMSARTYSATSHSSSNNVTNGSRRYRRVAHTPQVDDTLFGEKNQLLKNRKNERTLQAGR